MARVPDLAATPGVALHLYGKAEVRAGRKMGHANRVSRRQG
jgi:5-(carboxyamino)imidazole ribonucleotide synthase